MAHRVRDTLKAFKTVVRRARGGSDVSRWAKPENLHQSWDSRTEALAAFVPPGASVLEFGAGRRVLERFLPAGCRYTPSDLVDRGEGTILCDLNAPVLPVFPPHDVVVFSGVLEYVNDVPRLIRHLRPMCGAIAASYAQRSGTSVSQMLLRRQQGWVNDYTIEELIAVFSAEGFRCDVSQRKGSQRLFKFVPDA